MQQQKPQKPLEGGATGHYDHCAVAGDIHAGAGLHHRKRGDPYDRREPWLIAEPGDWVITSFGVANAISIPITGWLAKRVGEVKLFLWSTILFVLASPGLRHVQ